MKINEIINESTDFEIVQELKQKLLDKKKTIQSEKGNEKKVYDLIAVIMNRISSDHDITGQQLHDIWVKKYKKVPDTWIMDQ